jgi:hypothetical protein
MLERAKLMRDMKSRTPNDKKGSLSESAEYKEKDEVGRRITKARKGQVFPC